MVRQIVEQIEQLHSASAATRDARQADLLRSHLIEKALADCLQQLRAIVALEALDQVQRRPMLRVV
jgi:hypothetical protein